MVPFIPLGGERHCESKVFCPRIRQINLCRWQGSKLALTGNLESHCTHYEPLHHGTSHMYSMASQYLLLLWRYMQILEDPCRDLTCDVRRRFITSLGLPSPIPSCIEASTFLVMYSSHKVTSLGKQNLSAKIMISTESPSSIGAWSVYRYSSRAKKLWSEASLISICEKIKVI